jgi:hypothetical protein
MTNGNWNVINLTKDRTLYFDSDNPGKYGDYDLNVLQNSNETFDQVFLLKLEVSQIKESILRKDYLLQNLFVDIEAPDPKISSLLPSLDVDEQPTELTEPPILKASVCKTNSIIDLNDDQSYPVPFESLTNLPDDVLTLHEFKLEDDDELENEVDYLKEHVSVPGNQEKNMSYYERSMLNYQKLILKKVIDFYFNYY